MEVAERLPQGAAVQETIQETPRFVESPATDAVKFELSPKRTFATAGVTDTAAEGTVMAAEADLVVSETEDAVKVTDKLLEGGLIGAV